MGDTETIRWANDGRWGTHSTVTPVFGIYRVFGTSTPRTRDQKRVTNLNKVLRLTTK